MSKSKLKYIGNPKTLLAIDASTNSMAFSIFTERKLIKYGKVYFYGNHVYERVGDAVRKVSQFLKDIEIDAIVIESAIYTNSQNTAINLSLAQGAILGGSQMYHRAPIVSCSPVSWQSWIGNGRLKKEEKLAIRDLYGNDKSFSFYKAKEREFRKSRTIKKINIQFDLEISDDDVADAIAIGWYSSENWHKLVEQPHNLDKSKG